MTTQIRSLSHRRRIFSPAYIERVLATGPLVYMPLWDTDTGSVEDIGPNGWDGAGYTVTEPDPAPPNDVPFLTGSVAPYYEGTQAQSANAYSAAFRTAFPSQEGTLMTWVRLKDPAVTWPDATSRYFIRFLVDGSNKIELAKSSSVASGRIGLNYVAGGTSLNTHIWGMADIGFASWFQLVMAWSLSGDYYNVYVNGQQKSSKSGLGTWVGLPLWNRMILGTTNTDVWYGWQAHFAMWSSALPNPTIASLASDLGYLDDPTDITIT